MRIRVKTPARLHLGLLDINGDLGRLYGSIGVAIERPNVVLEAESLDGMSGPDAPPWVQVEGPEAERVATFAWRFLERYPLPCRVHLRLLAGIPAHVGLGSGTQLALAVGTALARLGGLRLSVPEIAVAVGRGVHSGIGSAAFQRGGFILDGGHRVTPGDQAGERKLPPILVQHPFPEQWYFVVVVPQISPGFSGERERSAFETLPQAPVALVEKISRLLLMKMLPALVERDILAFGQALTAIQQLVGDCFAAVQGGRYAHSLSEELIGFMLEQGAAGAGQSSWGPTVYGLVEGEAAARHLAGATQAFLAGRGEGQTFTVRADNRGAQVRVYRR